MKKIVLCTMIGISFAGSTLCAESWYSPYLQKIRSYFNPTTLGYATVGAAAGGYAAHRADWNPCIGAACGLLLGLSAEKLSNLYANVGKSEPKEPETYPTIPNPPSAQPAPPPIEQTQTSITSATQLPLKNPQKFKDDYQTIKDAVFKRFNSGDFENDFNIKYPQPTVNAVIELASHFDAVPIWGETWPVSATISIDGQQIPITGDIANIIYSNQDAINRLKQSYLE